MNYYLNYIKCDVIPVLLIIVVWLGLCVGIPIELWHLISPVGFWEKAAMLSGIWFGYETVAVWISVILSGLIMIIQVELQETK